MAGSVIKVENLSKHFGDTKIFDKVNFSLSKGKSACIVAPSGKGKSTLLSICGLLMASTSGRVLINDIDTSSLDDKNASILRGNAIGFMFQHTQLAGNFRANENVSMPISFCHNKEKSMTKQQIESRGNELLDHFDLIDKKYYYPNQLSIGQKRRIACARALFMHPELIIADEPTNDLDDENKAIVIDSLFSPVEQEKSALLFATHDLDIAKRADVIINL